MGDGLREPWARGGKGGRRLLAWLVLAEAARAAAVAAGVLVLLGALAAGPGREVAALRIGLPVSLAPAGLDLPVWGLR